MEISSILLTFNWIDHAEPITCPTGNYKSLCFAFTFANFQLPVATCLLPVACFLLPVFCCQLPLVGWLTDCFVLSCGSCFAPCYQISNTIQFAMLPHLLNSPFSFCLLGFLLLACLLELLVLLIRICNQFLGDAYICFHFLWRSRNQPERLAQAGRQSVRQARTSIQILQRASIWIWIWEPESNIWFSDWIKQSIILSSSLVFAMLFANFIGHIFVKLTKWQSENQKWQR